MGYSPQGLKELDSTKVTEDRARYRTFQVGLSGKESACQAGDLGLIAGSGSCLEEENGNHSSILAWRIPWTEEPDRLQSMGLKRVGGLSN